MNALICNQNHKFEQIKILQSQLVAKAEQLTKIQEELKEISDRESKMHLEDQKESS